MTKTRKIINVLWGVLMILVAIILMFIPEEAYPLVIIVLGIGLAIRGITRLINYFVLSSRSVGSTRLLYDGILILDLGIFTSALIDVPVFYLMIYFAGLYFFYGVIDILSAMDSKKLESPHFKYKLLQGLMNVLIAVLCIVFIMHKDIVIFIYCGGIIYNGIVKIVNAFRKTDMVFEDASVNTVDAVEEKQQ